jgi:succinate dehydrogenase / fumarate reductase, membrane anchor subunit
MQQSMSRHSLEEMAAQRDRSGSLWLTQAFSGLALVFILGLHMISHHFIVEGGLRNYQQVLEYVANPVVFVIEVLFVILAVVHALLGVRAIVIDLRPSAGAIRTTNWILVIVGALTIVYGIWLAVALQRLAGG